MLTVNSDEGSDDQPLDFSQKSHSDIKDTHPFAWSKKDVDKHIFTTPSPSPPESQSQVLCQLLSNYANKVKSGLNGHDSLITSPSGSANSDCYTGSNGSLSGNSTSFKSDLRNSVRKSTANVISSDSPISPLASLLDSTSPLLASQALALVSSNTASFMTNASNLLTTAPFLDPKKKHTRPFKAYPSSRDIGLTSLYNMPLTMSPDTSGHNLLASTSGPDYLQFRAQMLSQKRSAGDGRRKSSPGCSMDASLSPNTCSSVENGNSRRKNSSCSNGNRSTSVNLSDDSNQHSSCGEGETGSTNSTSSSLVGVASVGGGGGEGNAGGKNTSGNGLTGHTGITTAAAVAAAVAAAAAASAENTTSGLLATPAKLNGTQGQTANEESNGSSTQAAQATTTTPSSGRKRGRPLPDEQKDEAYWERRRKNNEAAKRSRDARRAKEDEIAIRAAYLEQQNIQLKAQIIHLRNELAKYEPAMSLTN